MFRNPPSIWYAVAASCFLLICACGDSDYALKPMVWSGSGQDSNSHALAELRLYPNGDVHLHVRVTLTTASDPAHATFTFGGRWSGDTDVYSLRIHDGDQDGTSLNWISKDVPMSLRLVRLPDGSLELRSGLDTSTFDLRSDNGTSDASPEQNGDSDSDTSVPATLLRLVGRLARVN